MADRIVSESDSSDLILQRIKDITDPNIKVTFQDSFPDLVLATPAKEDLVKRLKDKYKEADLIIGITDRVYDFLEAPIISYPGDPNDEHIDQVDKAIQETFEDSQKRAAYNVLQNNKMRVNMLLVPHSGIDLVSSILSQEDLKVAKELSEISKQLPNISDYKSQSPEERTKIVKVYTKASEMTLKSLNGQELEKQDWDIINGLK